MTASMRRLTLVVLIVLGCVLVDQAVKVVAAGLLPRGSEVALLDGTVRLVYTQNQGAFLSLGGSLDAQLRFWTLTIAVALLLAGLCLYVLWSRELGSLATIALSLMLGGGVSNLIDRLLHEGTVIDYIVLSVGPLHTGVFNVADVMIMGGTLGLLISGLRA